MKHSRGRVIDVTSLTDLDRRLAAGCRSLAGWRVVGLDLTGRGPALLDSSLAQSLFLGCEFDNGDEDAVRRAGAIVLHDIPGIPIDPYRAALYSPRELYDTPRYDHTLDARAYAWSRSGSRPDDTLARALHDHHVDAALDGVGGRSFGRGRDGRTRPRARKPGVRRGGPSGTRARAPGSRWPPVAVRAPWRRPTWVPSCPATCPTRWTMPWTP